MVLALVAAVSLAADARARQQAPAPAAVSVEQEPRHRPVFENAFARVLDVRVPGGDTTLYHTHSNRMATVVIETATSWTQVLGGERDAPRAGDPVGSVMDNWSSQLPYTHRVGNVDTTTFHYVAGEWLASPGPDGPKLPDSRTIKLEKESAMFRVYRITLPPFAASEHHQHGSPGMTVQVRDGRLADEGSTATASGGGPGGGAWRWRAAGHSHRLRNGSSAPLDVIEVDWLSGKQASR